MGTLRKQGLNSKLLIMKKIRWKCSKQNAPCDGWETSKASWSTSLPFLYNMH